MFDNLFTSSTSIWTGLITGAVLLPILIHLINLVRYKKVKFAAMEFLLQSQKQSRSNPWLKQLLLLLARIAVLLLALFLIAQVGCQQDRIARILGGRSTHHYVLIDDSFSMTDVGNAENATGNPSAFEHAKSVLTAIAGRVSNRQNQKFSLLRMSAIDPSGLADGGLGFDIENLLVDSSFNRRLDETKAQLHPCSLELSPQSVIGAIAAMIEDRNDETPILYVLSDFRSKDWERLSKLSDSMMKIRNANGAVELIDCAGDAGRNLAVVDLAPAGNVRVASTPLMMELKVKNLSQAPVSKIRVRVATETYSQASSPLGLVSKTEDLPAVFIEAIAPGETVSRRFPVFFTVPGAHVVRVQTGQDAVQIDNQRDCVVQIEQRARVLLIDDARLRHASFVELALNPNDLTGIETLTQTKDYLRDVTADELAQFDVIFLLDVDVLDGGAVDKLNEYCLAGGGVAFFLGPNANLPFYNGLFERLPDLFPIELGQRVAVEEDSARRAADFVPQQHPVFAPVLNQKTSLLELVQIESVVAPTRQWLLNRPASVQTIATVRGDTRRPLLVESAVGQGRVMVCTTTAGPVWNNWARNATFLPILLLMEDHLAGGKKRAEDSTLGVPCHFVKDGTQYRTAVTMLSPGDGTRRSNRFEVTESRAAEDLAMNSSGETAEMELVLPTLTPRGRQNFDSPGVYDLWFQKTAGTYEVQRKAINVDVGESQLERVKSAQLLGGLKEAQPVWVRWDQFNPEPELRPASSLTRLCLALLVVMLAIEPLMAYLATFHHK